MEDRFNKLEEKVDRVLIVQERQGTMLAEYIQSQKDLKTEMGPIKEHVHQWSGAGKALMITIPILSVIAAFLKVFL